MKRYYITCPASDMPTLNYFDEKGDIYEAPVHPYDPNGVRFDGLNKTLYGYFDIPGLDLPEELVKERKLVPGIVPVYYTIDEAAARRAKEAISWSDYKSGSKTAEYRLYVDNAAVLAEACKATVDPMYHEQIDKILNTYCYKLAENFNADSRITASCPSVMIAGGSNFPVNKKRKQVSRLDKNMQEYQEIQELLHKMRSVGHGGISSDDPNAVTKLKAKLQKLEEAQETMKKVNAWYRQNKTVIGCPHLSEENAAKLDADMKSRWHAQDKPFQAFELSNNSQEIRRLKDRIGELEKRQSEPAPEGWKFDGGEVVINTEINRLQVLFDEKPDAETRDALKHSGFRWSPKESAWQRQYTRNAVYAAKSLKILAPVEAAS